MGFFGSNIQEAAANKLSRPYYHFNGDASVYPHIQVADNAKFDFGTRNFSFECSFKPHERGRLQRLGKHYNGTGWIVAILADNKINYWQRSESPDVQTYEHTSTATITVDEWHHLVVSVNRFGNVSIYINGVLDSAGSIAAGRARTINDDGNLLLFGEPDQNTFHGEAGMVRLWNYDLPIEEVQELYSGANVPNNKRASDNVNIGMDNSPTSTENEATSGTSGWQGNYSPTITNEAVSSMPMGTARAVKAVTSSGVFYFSTTAMTVVHGQSYRVRMVYKNGDSANGGFACIHSYNPWNGYYNDADIAKHTIRIDGVVQTTNILPVDNDWHTYTFDFTVPGKSQKDGRTGTSFYSMFETNGGNGGDLYVETYEMWKTGIVGEWDGSTMTSGFWYDKSGNENPGRVTNPGVSIQNKITAIEAPLTISVGTADNSIATALKLTKAKTDGAGGNDAGPSIDFYTENADGGLNMGAHQKVGRVAGYTSSATGGGNFDGGLKFYTNDSETDQLALTITNAKKATFGGKIEVNNTTDDNQVIFGDQSRDTNIKMAAASGGARDVEVLQLGSTLYVGPTSGVVATVLRAGSTGLSMANNGNATFAGQVLGANGAVGTPTYSFTNSTGMGLYRFADNKLGFAVSSTLRAIIDNYGFFGVGTDDPKQKIHLHGGQLAFSSTEDGHPSYITNVRQDSNSQGIKLGVTSSGAAADALTITHDKNATFTGVVNMPRMYIGVNQSGYGLNVQSSTFSGTARFANTYASGTAYGVIAQSEGACTTGKALYLYCVNAGTNYALHAEAGDVWIQSGKVGVGKVASYTFEVGGSGEGSFMMEPFSQGCYGWVDNSEEERFYMAAFDGTYNGSYGGMVPADYGVLYSYLPTGIMIGADGNTLIQFRTNSAQRLTITGSGEIGIGTATPGTTKLYVTGSTTNFLAQFQNTHATDGHGVAIHAGDDASVNMLVLNQYNGTRMVTFRADGNVGIGTDAPGETFHIKSTSDSVGISLETTSTSHIAVLDIKAAHNSYGTGLAKCVRFWEGGTVRNTIGVPSTGTDADGLCFYVGNADTSADAKLHSNADWYTNDGSVSSLSDKRGKKDIEDLTDGLDIVKQLKPVTYKHNGLTWGKDDGVTRYGFVADDVLTVASQYVHVEDGKVGDEDVDDLKSISMMRMFPMLVKAVQELSLKVEALEAEVSGSS